MIDISPDPTTLDSIQPVLSAKPEPTGGPRPGIALCLSGGGYRAMIFHLGTLLSLNELGFLKKLARVSSVSGGSITAGVLRPAWKSYNIADYGLPDAMNCPFDETIKLAAVATRLKALDATLQEKIINWGYAVCDAALRKHVDGTLPAAVAFPCKNSPKNEERQSYPHRWSNSSPNGTVRSVKL